MPNGIDDLKIYNGTSSNLNGGGPVVGGSDRDRNSVSMQNRDRTMHDPYRFTRSTQQPIKSTNNIDSIGKSSKPPDYPQYR